jgi:Lar family restriction alleviation protein
MTVKLSEAVELLPCPFCGHPESVSLDRCLSRLAYVECLGCSAHGPAKDHERGAIAEWNTRSSLKGDEEMGWQPIATAPKDNTLVLLGNQGNYQLGRFNPTLGYWADDCGDDLRDTNGFTATHWTAIKAITLDLSEEPLDGASDHR